MIWDSLCIFPRYHPYHSREKFDKISKRSLTTKHRETKINHDPSHTFSRLPGDQPPPRGVFPAVWEAPEFPAVWEAPEFPASHQEALPGFTENKSPSPHRESFHKNRCDREENKFPGSYRRETASAAEGRTGDPTQGSSYRLRRDIFLDSHLFELTHN
jgi:hypothetical protein